MDTSLRYKIGWSTWLTFLVSKSDTVLVGSKVVSTRTERPTNNEVILRRDLGLKSHPKDGRNGGSILRSLDW